jgi:hypothetical protein
MQELAHPSTTMSPLSATRDTAAPGLLQSPGLLSDAVQRLALAARDRPVHFHSPKSGHDANNILRIMTNLLTFPDPRVRRGMSSQTRDADDATTYQLLATRLSKVVIRSATEILRSDRNVAEKYIFQTSSGPTDVCLHNATVAANHGRFGHQRMFMALGAFCRKSSDQNAPSYLFKGAALRMLKALYAQLLFPFI